MDVSADDITNKNLYEFCHAEDLQKLRKAHVDCKFYINTSYKCYIHVLHVLAHGGIENRQFIN